MIGARSLARTQRQIIAGSRFGIPAVVHEECLTGLAAWQATIYPAPLSWGATFDPDLVRRMAAQIGRTMRGLGVHQGLAPVLDVARDLRWGRVEETIGEDPYLVGTIGSAYVARPRVGRDRRHAEALRRVLRLARRPQPGAGFGGAARDRRRPAAAVRAWPCARAPGR